MPVAKVIEILAQSNESWEEAAKIAVQEASKSLDNIKHIYIKEMQADVDNNQITTFRVNAKVTFLVK